MATTLLTTGLLCVIAAIVGGGIEALGGKVPVIQSSKRQTALGLFGTILLLGAWFSPSSNAPGAVPSDGSQAPSKAAIVTPQPLPPRSGSDGAPMSDRMPAAKVQVTDVAVRPVNKAHPNLLAIEGVAHLENVGEVGIHADCPWATAILAYMVPGPNGPQMTPGSWRTLGQQHANCNVDVGVGEAPTFPIYITFDKPTEDSLYVNLMVQFHEGGFRVPEGERPEYANPSGRVWSASAKARIPE
jgi:hypothetical protein